MESRPPQCTVESLLSELETLVREVPNGVLAFDGDGTLWTGDVGEECFFAALASGDIRPDAAARLASDTTEFGLEVDPTPASQARILYDAYTCGRFPEERMCEVMAYLYAGWTRQEVSRFVRETVPAPIFAARAQREVTAVAEWARGQGIDLYVVSASPVFLVEPAVHAIGLDKAQVLGAALRVEGDKYTDHVLRPIPYGLGKVEHLKRVAPGRKVYAAFGDNVFDIPLLRYATLPVAVRPKERLLAHAGDVPGLRGLVTVA